MDFTIEFAGLAGLVGELDGEVHLVAAGGHGVGGLAVVGAHLGVLEVAVSGLGVAAKVLDTVVEAGAERDGVGGAGLHSDALEDLVGKGAKSVLDAGSGDDVGGGSDDAISAPDAAIGVVVDHDELLAHAGVGGESSVGVASGDVAGGETARAEVGVVHGGPGTEGKGFAGPGGHIAGGTVTGGGSTASTGEHDLGKGVALGDVGNGDGAKF